MSVCGPVVFLAPSHIVVQGVEQDIELLALTNDEDDSIVVAVTGLPEGLAYDAAQDAITGSTNAAPGDYEVMVHAAVGGVTTVREIVVRVSLANLGELGARMGESFGTWTAPGAAPRLELGSTLVRSLGADIDFGTWTAPAAGPALEVGSAVESAVDLDFGGLGAPAATFDVALEQVRPV